MKNDYEFLKDKLENSGVKAPESIDERYVLDRLEGIEPEQAPAPVLREIKPKKRRTGLIVGIAAAFAAVVGLSVFGAIRLMQKPPVTSTTPIVSADIPLKRFESYDEVRAQVKENAERTDYLTRDGLDYERMAVEEGAYDTSEQKQSDASAGSSSSGSSSDSHSETYRQVEGVDEADYVKTDGRYLYIVAGDESVGIFSSDDQPRLLAEIVPGALSATPDEVDEDDGTDVFVREMFLYGEKLVLVGVSRDKSFDYSTVSLVYDVSDIGSIRLVDSFHQSGNYTASRMIGDNLYMISEYRLRRDDFEIPTCYSGDAEREIPIGCVYSVEEPESSDMLIVGGYSLSDSSGEVSTAAVIGAVEDVYCNEDNLYIYTTKWNYRNWYVTDDFGLDTSDDEEERITTDIFKVSLHDGISFTACGSVEGWLDSRYSLDEHNGFLRVAATLENANYDDVNALYVLDENLKKVGSVTGFAENESIKAVRYVGDTAYVITYEQTDPLFVIDVSDPTAPVILGEVKIDGFSSMLVPVDENTVLGLGFYTEDSDNIDMQVQMGFKLALFDVSDKTAPKVLDEKNYREHYSNVMYEPRALVYNPERGDYLIPLNSYSVRSVTDSNADASDAMPENRGGALNFKVENGRIVEIDRPAAESGDGDFYLVSRCLYVGDTIYMVSNENGLAENVRVYTAKYQ